MLGSKARPRDSNEGPLCPKSHGDHELHHIETSLAAIGQQCNGSECQPMTASDTRLQKLVATWSTLPEVTKRAIEALCCRTENLDQHRAAALAR